MNQVRLFLEKFTVDCRDVAKSLLEMLGFSLIVIIELLTVLGSWMLEIEGFGMAIVALLVFVFLLIF